MAFSTEVGTFVMATATGSQEVNLTGAFQPSVVIFFNNDLTADGTASDATWCMGAATSATARRAACFEADDGAATSDVGVSRAATQCIRIVDDNAGLLAAADFTSMDSDGFTINWATNDGVARHIGYIALGGSDLTNAAVGGDTVPASTGDQAYTSVGFQPDCMIFFMSGSSATMPETVSGNIRMHIGFASGASAEGYVGGYDLDAQGADDSQSQFTTSDCIAAPTTSGGVLWRGDLTSFDATGYTINWDTVSSGRHFFWVALKGIQAKVGTFNQKTSTGTDSVTGVGFQPSCLLLASANGTAASQDDLKVSFGAASSTSARACVWVGADDAADPMADDQDLDTAAIIKLITPGTPTLNAEADLSSFDSDGFTLNWTTADGTARNILYLALGAAPADSSTVPQRLPAWEELTRTAGQVY